MAAFCHRHETDYRPRGSAFLHGRREAQVISNPLLLSQCRCANGESLEAICRETYCQGVKTKRGNEFHKTSLYSILTNPIYAGRQSWNRYAKTNEDGLYSATIRARISELEQKKKAFEEEIRRVEKNKKKPFYTPAVIQKDIEELFKDIVSGDPAAKKRTARLLLKKVVVTRKKHWCRERDLNPHGQ